MAVPTFVLQRGHDRKEKSCILNISPGTEVVGHKSYFWKNFRCGGFGVLDSHDLKTDRKTPCLRYQLHFCREGDAEMKFA